MGGKIMLQFKYAMYDYKKNLGLMIIFLIQLIVLFVSIFNISDEVLKSYLSYKTMTELYEYNKDCILFNGYFNMEGKENLFEEIKEPLKSVLMGQDEAKAMTYCTSGDIVYILGNWKKAKPFKDIPYTSDMQIYNGNDYKGDDYEKFPPTILLKDGKKGNIFNIDKNKIIFVNENIWFDKYFRANFFETEEMVNNLILFTDDFNVIEEYVNGVNANIDGLIIPITIKEALNDLKLSFFSFGNDLEIFLFMIIFTFSIITGLISLMYLIIDTNMREYAIHFIVGATVQDI
ncbi:MAG TPA: hypothetical protein VK982_16155, partial [Bacteroidales bacterium]|nr:hypothetical protein [Bacteroidales bacterium]